MSKIVYFTALLMCGVLVSAQSKQSSSAQALDAISKAFEKYSPAAVCPRLCAQGCFFDAAICIDIPSNRDCEAEGARCSDACAQLCECMTTCESSCQVQTCEGLKGFEMSTCITKNVACLGHCEVQCPVNQLTKLAETEMKEAATTLNRLMATISSAFTDLNGATP